MAHNAPRFSSVSFQHFSNSLWDNGEKLTRLKCEEVLAGGSSYEKNRLMNIFHNKRLAQEVAQAAEEMWNSFGDNKDNDEVNNKISEDTVLFRP